MSCSSYGYVIIGCKIDEKKLNLAIEKIRDNSKKETTGCSHDVPEQNKFCPECGAPKKIITMNGLLSVREFLDNINGLFVVASTDEEDFFGTIDRKYIVRTGDINESGGGYRELKIPSVLEVNDISSKLEQILSPYGLWDENNFKIWLVGYCSY